jgi:hypothetical protein
MKYPFFILLLIAIAFTASVSAKAPPGHGDVKGSKITECPYLCYAPAILQAKAQVLCKSISHMPVEAKAESGTYASRYDARVRRSNKHQFVVYLPDKYRKGNKDIHTSITRQPSAGSAKGDSTTRLCDDDSLADEVEA